jgi:hypothetical protein
MCILDNQRDATYTVFFIIISPVHVSGSFSAHHQELINMYVQPWVLSCFPAVYRWCGWAVPNQPHQHNNTQGCTYSFISSRRWVEKPPKTCRALIIIKNILEVASCWLYKIHKGIIVCDTHQYQLGCRVSCYYTECWVCCESGSCAALGQALPVHIVQHEMLIICCLFFPLKCDLLYFKVEPFNPAICLCTSHTSWKNALHMQQRYVIRIMKISCKILPSISHTE